jgi:hypothetical protein
LFEEELGIMATNPKKVSVRVTSKRGTSAGVGTSLEISEEDVRFRAYEIYQQRTGRGVPGDQASDWLQAERELVEQALTSGSAQVLT